VGPVQPVPKSDVQDQKFRLCLRYAPPHCPHCVWVGPLAEVEVDEVKVDEVVGLIVGVDVVVVSPLPTEVVTGPFSTYTPLKYQSSGVWLVTIRRTPKCQSAELVDVEAAMF